jgi:hypothetical protein
MSTPGLIAMNAPATARPGRGGRRFAPILMAEDFEPAGGEIE